MTNSLSRRDLLAVIGGATVAGAGLAGGDALLADPAAASTSYGQPAIQELDPVNDNDNALLVQAPANDTWGMNQPYGHGQAIIYMAGTDTYASVSTDTEEEKRTRYRIDANGGVGACGGYHIATGRNIPQTGIYQHVWIDGQYMDIVGIVVTQHPSAKKAVFLGENSAGQGLFNVDSAQNLNVDAPDNVARAIQVFDSGGTPAAALFSSTNGRYGARQINQTRSAGTVGLLIQGYTGQTADLQQWKGGSGNTLLEVLAGGQLKTSGGNEATGFGTALLGSNCPATTITEPYKWLKFTTSDGSQVYVPAWK